MDFGQLTNAPASYQDKYWESLWTCCLVIMRFLVKELGIWKQDGEEGKEPALEQRRGNYKGNQWNR